jgi:hypothetical protein
MPLSEESTRQRYARGNEHDLDRLCDGRRRSEAYAFLCAGALSLPRSTMVRPFHGSASRRCLPPVLLRSRLRDRPRVANVPTRAHLSVHPSSLRNDPVFPRRFPLRPRPSPRLEKPPDGP